MKQPKIYEKRNKRLSGIFGPVLLAVIILALLFSLSGCGVPSPKPYLAEDRDSRWLNDITYLEKTLPQVHKNLYFRLPEEEFHRQLAELKAKVPAYSDAQIEIALSVILAGIGDSHTGLSIGSEYSYPLELHWFAEGIYIMGTSREYQDLLDARIITLNGRKIKEAAQTLRPLLAGANESWFKTQVVYYLPLPAVLQYFGLSRPAEEDGGNSEEITLGEEITLEVELPDGRRREIQMKPVSYKDYVAAERPAGPVPLYRSRPNENYWYEYLPQEKIMYLNYSSCRQMREKPFEIFAKEFWDFAQSRDAEKLVLDIRDNRGGSSTILDPFIQEIKNSRFNQEGKLYVIIGKDTYSSAILNAIRLKKETKAIFVGEATGGEPNHYGEVKRFTLPNSEIQVRYSTKYFSWADGDGDTLMPDKVIPETFTAYRDGSDPVLAWIGTQEN